MGVVFFLGFLWAAIIILIVGIVGYILFYSGIIGLIIDKILRSKGKNVKVVLRVLSIIANVIGFIISIPLNIVIVVAIVSFFSPPDDYVETTLVIEENGRQYDKFTVDGEVYESLPFVIYGWEYPEIGTPIFSWKTEGFFNQGKMGNYYSIENSTEYEIIWDGEDTLFCKQIEMEDVLEHYYEGSIWYIYCNEYSEYTAEVDYEYIETLEKLEILNLDELNTIKINDSVERTWIGIELHHNKDNDNFRCLYKQNFAIIEGKMYYRKNYDSNIYAEIPSEIASRIMEFHNKELAK